MRATVAGTHANIDKRFHGLVITNKDLDEQGNKREREEVL